MGSLQYMESYAYMRINVKYDFIIMGLDCKEVAYKMFQFENS